MEEEEEEVFSLYQVPKAFSDLLASYSIYFCFANYFPYYFHPIFFQHLSGFDVSSLVSSTCIIIGLTVSWYI